MEKRLMSKIKIGTRRSELAIVQTQWVIRQIRSRYPDLELETVTIHTRGDRILDLPLDRMGGKGLFSAEIETALLDGTIDLAVHSMKDLPARISPGVVIAAVSPREDHRDVLISYGGEPLSDLATGARVGTSSLRRAKQLTALRPDLKIELLRGNVPTRLEKLEDRKYDAIVLAAAGLKRLGLEAKITQYFTVDEMIPAVCQGILAVQTRADDTCDFLGEAVHCPEAACCGTAERAFLIRLDGGCTIPMGAYASLESGRLRIRGMIARTETPEIFRTEVAGPPDRAVELGERLALRLLEQCGGKL
jgi:hydroxymethylbilane synthase